MINRFSLFAGTAICTLAMSAGAAHAKPVKHRATHKAAASAGQSEEIRALKAQIEALNARLDAQEASQHATQASAEQAQAQAAAAATQAQQAQTQIAEQTQAMPAQVKDQVKTAMNSAPKQWFNDTSISGRMYFNFSNINQKVDGANSTANGTGFNVKRFYIGVDHKFDDVFSANITTDIDNVIGNNNSNLVGKGLYVKKAYLQAKLNKALVVRLGSADMPWIPYAEGIYGYRHIEQTLIDRTKFGTSADWGIHLGGDLANGIVSYAVSVVDGGGYRNVKVTKSVDVEGRVSVQYKGFNAAIGGYSGKLANNVQNVVTPHTAQRINALLAYKTRLFTLGGEYFHAKNWDNNGFKFVTTNLTDTADGYSVFGSINPLKKVSLFSRYDWVKPNNDVRPGMRDHYFNAGVQYSPAKIVDLALVYKRETANNGTISTGNGTIGGINRGTYDEFGLFGQFRF